MIFFPGRDERLTCPHDMLALADLEGMATVLSYLLHTGHIVIVPCPERNAPRGGLLLADAPNPESEILAGWLKFGRPEKSGLTKRGGTRDADDQNRDRIG